MSGMDELLDEAIAKAKEVGDSQLVEWLRMARGGKSAVRWYAIKLRDLEAENAKLRKQVTKLQDDWESERDYADQMEAKEQRAVAENAKLRDAMYTNAGKHALQHMDEDELRIWATQQSEYIEELRGICADMLTCINAYKARKLICWECEHHRAVDELRSVCFLVSDARRLGIEGDE